MSVRNKTHNGRDRSGHFRVKQADLEELRTDPDGEDYVRDDVRLGGAVADTGMRAGEWGKHIGDLAGVNRKRVKAASGQQSGSNRPAERTGSAKRAPKKAEVPPKGTARPGVARKSRPTKTNVMRKARSRKA